MIEKAAIEALIPHAGRMCLLDTVESWDDEHVVCRSRSHRDPSNPLRRADGLAAVHGVEYAAQAMAVHGGLLRAARGASGYLAGLRRVVLAVRRLDDIEADLIIEARRLVVMVENVLYEFRIEAAGVAVARGRATVVVPAAAGP